MPPPSPGTCTPPGVPPPPLKLLPLDDDFSFLRDSARRTDPWDPVKYVPLDRRGLSYLTFGGEARERYEDTRNFGFGQGPQPKSDGYGLQRYLLSADLHLGAGFRLFTQLTSGTENGWRGDPRPSSKDDIDLGQAVVELRAAPGKGQSVTLRTGRQEMAFGSQRLISIAEGLNTRTRFDGLRLLTRFGSASVDGLLVRPVNTRPGRFDDGADYRRLLWGVYATVPVGVLPGGAADVYFLNLDSRQSAYGQGAGRETRRTLGTRLFGKRGAWDYDDEFIYQWGRFTPVPPEPGAAHLPAGDVGAFSVALNFGYTAKSLPCSPRFGLKADVASGDRDPKRRGLQTFSGLFPNENYFTLAALAGPSDFVDVHPGVDFAASKNVVVTAAWDFFWRESLNDTVYSASGMPLFPKSASRARYDGSLPDLQAVWAADRHITVLADYEHFFPGGYVHGSGGRSVDYVSTWVAYKF